MSEGKHKSFRMTRGKRIGLGTVVLLLVAGLLVIALTAPKYLTTGHLLSPVTVAWRPSLLTNQSVLVLTNESGDRLGEVELVLKPKSGEMQSYRVRGGLAAEAVAELGPLEGLNWKVQNGDVVVVHVPGHWPRVAVLGSH